MSGIKIARATKEDMDGAIDLHKFLQIIDQGSFPPDDDDADDWPEFDEDNHEHLTRFYETVMRHFNHPPSGLMRVLMAASCALDERNKLFDPSESHLEFHPRIQQADELAEVLLAALPYVEDAAEDPCYKPIAVAAMVKRMREALAKAGAV